jgi:putative transcriptional regulator
VDPVSFPGRRVDLTIVDSLAGHFLIASPAIIDPNFHRTVVLITAHTEEGAVGLIVNRRSEATVQEAVPQLDALAELDALIFVGGPVNAEGVAVLAEFEDPDDAGVVVLDDVGFVALDEALETEPPRVQRARVFAGVAGWGPDQLESEFAREDWIVAPARADDIFTDDPDSLWSNLLRRKGGQYELVARMPVDPSLN